MKYTYFVNLCWLDYLQPFGVVPCFEDGDLILIGKVHTTYNCSYCSALNLQQNLIAAVQLIYMFEHLPSLRN